MPLIRPEETLDRLAADSLTQDETPKVETPAKKSAVERWRDNIKAAKLTEAEAEAILDAMLLEGYWEKTVNLYRGKLKVVFRTRDSFSILQTALAVDRLQHKEDERAVAQVSFRIALAGSLAQYRDKVMAQAKQGASNQEVERAFNQRLDFIDKEIPAAVVTTLWNALVEFDNEVGAALSEGAESGF
jgi:hypothetical protein